MTTEALFLKQLVIEGMPAEEHFEVIEEPLTSAALEENEIDVKLVVVSADPYIRGLIKSGPVPRVMEAFVGAEVIASKSDEFPVGTIIGGRLPLRATQRVNTKQEGVFVWKHPSDAPVSLAVGTLGMPGSTSYGGLVGVLRPLKGQTIFVSGAAGAVGSVVAQIAKNEYDCVVVGSAGGPEKCQLIKDKFGVDHAIDYKLYKNAAELEAAIRERVPEGIDMYFDNVGGMHFDAAFSLLKPHGRMAICGGISQYNKEKPAGNTINPLQMIYSFQRIEGFVCTPWLAGPHREAFITSMKGWIKEGKIHPEETFFDGSLANWIQAFQALFTGANKGKVVLRLK